MLEDVPLDGTLGAAFAPLLDGRLGITLVAPFDVKFEGVFGAAWATCHNRDVIILVAARGTTAPVDGEPGDIKLLEDTTGPLGRKLWKD